MTYAFITAAEAAATIHHGDTVGIGGFSSVGTPKAVPEALAAYAEAQHAQGKEFKVGLITGGATGCQVDSALVKAHAVSFRTPFQSNKDMRESINQHEVQYFDLHLSQIGQDVRYGFLGKIHVAIVEASDLTDDGEIILSTSVGISPTLLQVAERVIIELNEAHTGKLTGMHDIYIPANPPYRTEIPVYHVNDRAGHISVKIDPKKITGVVRTNARDHIAAFTPQMKQPCKSDITWLPSYCANGRTGPSPRSSCPCSRVWATLPMRYWVHWATTRTFRLSPCLRR